LRTPDLHRDGWCLEDGEVLRGQAPDTFQIPNLFVRRFLQPRDFAKLVFKISLEGEDNRESVERMWVIVRERIEGGYVGILDNNPDTIGENDSLWSGTELPFEPRHIIAAHHGDADSRRLAAEPPPIPWDRS
jgi:hypothetical protein